MENTKNGGSGAIVAKKRRLPEGTLRTVVEMGGGILLGILLPRAAVYGGLMPFGVALTAAISGPSAVLVYASALLGYLLQGVGTSLRYAAAIVLVMGLRWSVSGFERVARSRVFPAICAFLSVLITGSTLLLGARPSAEGILLIVSESTLAAGFAYFAAVFFREIPFIRQYPLSDTALMSAVVLFAVAMMSLLSVEFSGISVGRIACSIAVLLAARCAHTSGGCFAGIMMGVAVLLSTPDLAYLSPAFALGGLLVSVFAEKGKWIAALIYPLAFGIVSVRVPNGVTVLFTLYEAVAAGLIFCAVPSRAERVLQHVIGRSERLPEVHASRRATSMKLDYAAKAMSEVVGTVDTVSCQLTALGAPEIGSVCREGANEVCCHCPKRTTCWETHFSEVMDALNHTIPHLRANGSIGIGQVTGYLRTQCDHLSTMVERLNERYREFLVRESAFRRLNELRAIVNDQFGSMATMLEEFSEQLTKPEWVDCETERRIRQQLRSEEALQAVACRVSGRGRMTVELVLAGRHSLKDKEKLRRTIGELSGKTFSPPLVETQSGQTRITLTEKNTYRVTVGTAQLSCEGEALCGDAYEIFRDSEGSQLLVLSDGMGSGGRAAVDSAMAAGLAVRLLKAGFGYESMLKMINTALMAKSEDESLATLDVVDINLFSGEVKLLKAGAGASLIVSKGRISRVEESSLPLGILREVTFAKTEDRLVEGDLLITMSDGVSNEGLSWVEEVIKGYDAERGDRLSDLADAIAQQARQRQGDDQDDVTVMVTQLHKIA